MITNGGKYVENRKKINGYCFDLYKIFININYVLKLNEIMQSVWVYHRKELWYLKTKQWRNLRHFS